MDNVKFFYVSKKIIQLGFDGRSYSVDIPDSECHIVYGDQTICGSTMEKGKRLDGKKSVIVKVRPLGVKLCEKCQDGYKKNKQLDWHKWTRNISVGSDGV